MAGVGHDAAREPSLCAANNVDWYEAIFRTHGLSGRVAGGMWISRDRPPPYYSNAVTLSPADSAAQRDAILGLAASLGPPFSVKDSFALLDLAPHRFRPLFDAEWIWLDADATRIPRQTPSTTVWRRVTTAAELERWEAAWRDSGSPTERRVFLPALLREPVAPFAGERGGRIVAGSAANLSPEVVGFSNFFAAAGEDADAHLAAAVDETARFAPGLPIVGYERGEDLARARRLGFRSVGGLRVWITDDA